MSKTLHIVPGRTRKPKVKSKTKRRVQSRSRIIKALDSIFSLYVRTKYADKNGLVQCYTCETKLPIKKMQNGHYVSRSIRVLRWNEENTKPQCFGCNIMHGGRPIDFREYLIAELGEPKVKKLEAKRKELFNPSDEWLLTETKRYELLLSQIKQ